MTLHPDSADPRARDHGQPKVEQLAVAPRLAEFTIWCVAISWFPLIPLILSHGDLSQGPGLIAFLIATAGPSLAALAMWFRHPRERRPRQVRAGWRWPVAAISIGAVPFLIAGILVYHHDLSAIPAAASIAVASAGGPFVAVGLTLLAGPLAEEFGWRGYVQPRLRQRMSPAATAVVLGLGWGLWHVPLFLLPGTGQYEMGLTSLPGVMFFVAIVAFSYPMLVVTERLRGGVPAAVLAHASLNAAHDLMPPFTALGSVLLSAVIVCLALAMGLVCRNHGVRHSPAISS